MSITWIEKINVVHLRMTHKNICCPQRSPTNLLNAQNVKAQADDLSVYIRTPHQVTFLHPWQSLTEEAGSVHVPGRGMCWMEVHFGVASTQGVTVVTVVQRAGCREHSVSETSDTPALEHNQQNPFLSAATSNPNKL